MEDDIDDEQIEAPVTMELGFSKIIVVDNTPQVPQEKHEKLQKVLLKVFTAFGTVTDLYMPLGSDGLTKGYIRFSVFLFQTAAGSGFLIYFFVSIDVGLFLLNIQLRKKLRLQ